MQENPIETFKTILAQHGFHIDEIIADGQLHLAIERFKEPLELVKALIDSEIGFCDGLASKIHEYLLYSMQILAADEVILVQLPVKGLVALQKSRADLKQEIVQTCADERISRSQAGKLIRWLCLEAA